MIRQNISNHSPDGTSHPRFDFWAPLQWQLEIWHSHRIGSIYSCRTKLCTNYGSCKVSCCRQTVWQHGLMAVSSTAPVKLGWMPCALSRMERFLQMKLENFQWGIQWGSHFSTRQLPTCFVWWILKDFSVSFLQAKCQSFVTEHTNLCKVSCLLF